MCWYPPLLVLPSLLTESFVSFLLIIFVSIARLFVFLIFADFVQAWVKASVLKGGLSALLPLLPLTSWQPLTAHVHLESTRQPACSDKPNRRNSTVYKRMELGAFPTALEIAMVFLG